MKEVHHLDRFERVGSAGCHVGIVGIGQRTFLKARDICVGPDAPNKLLDRSAGRVFRNLID